MTSPVTQNEDAAVKKESINGVAMPLLAETGRLRTKAPIKTIPNVPNAIICV
jgi:hypothetical protein